MKFISVFFSCILLCCSTLFADTHYVDINNSSPSSPYTNWVTAANDIQSAVNAAENGDTILIADGTYQTTAEINVDKSITIQSINGPKAVTVDAGGYSRVFRLRSHAGPIVLEGLTVSGGYTTGDGGGIRAGGPNSIEMINCIIEGNAAWHGGGILGGRAVNCTIEGNTASGSGGGMSYGTANNCIISDNSASEGGGMAHGTANNCTIEGNTASGSGGGMSYGTAENCEISNNSADSGGGMYNGMAQNCFIENNTAAGGIGGGMFRGTAWNCAISHNSAFLGGGIYNATIYNCTVTRNVAPVGGGMHAGEAYNSIFWYNVGRVVHQDMNQVAAINCCSPDVEHGIAGNITNMPLLVSASHLASDSPCIAAGHPDFAAGTDMDRQLWLNPPSMGCDEFHGAGSVTGALYVAIGEANDLTEGIPSDLFADISGPVSSQVWDFGDGTTETNKLIPKHIWKTPGTYEVKLTAYNDSWPGGVSATQAVHVASLDEATLYVDAAGGDDANDGSDWANAKRSINAAVESHRYYGGRILVTNGIYGLAEQITVDKSLLVESVNGPEETIIDGNASHLCVYLGPGCRLRGCSVRNGIGGIRGFYSSVIDRCRVYENDGTGIWGGGVYDSVIRNNMNPEGVGGGLDDANAYNCIIVSNTARYGGGIDMSGGSNGDFAEDYLAVNCVVSHNSAVNGGGILGGEARNCLVTGNEALWGGGIYKTIAVNCTIADNTALYISGASESSLYNSIVCSNSSVHSYPEISADCYSAYSCSTGLVHGADGNINTNPLFIDPANGDYRLLATSPCIDEGLNDYIMATDDLDGHPRIIDGDLDGTATVDMGAYEFQVVTIPADCIRMPTINTKSKGRTPVTIRSTAEFDASLIDPASVRCADAVCVHQIMKDVDDDGIKDLKLHFPTSDMIIDVADGKVLLLGQTYDGTYVVGVSEVKMR